VKALVFRHSLAREAASAIGGRAARRAFVSRVAPVRLEDVDEQPLPASDRVRVRTTFSGLCGSDVKQILLNGSRDNPLTAGVVSARARARGGRGARRAAVPHSRRGFRRGGGAGGPGQRVPAAHPAGAASWRTGRGAIQLAGRRAWCWNAAVDRTAVLAEFDDQMRRNPAGGPRSRVEREPHVTRLISSDDGWSGVLWADLSSVAADSVIDAEVSRFAGLGRPWEWKYYSYDQPADLPARLHAAGFVPEPPETLLVAPIADLNLDASAPDGVELVPVTDARGVSALVGVHDEVFGGDHAATGSAITAALASQPRPVEAVVAVAGDTAISAGRVEFPADSDFASLWGGGTLPAWRGRGVFRSLVAYRAGLARERGYRYLQVDASADSSPILQRLGFAELARTTPFVYPGYQAAT